MLYINTYVSTIEHIDCSVKSERQISRGVCADAADDDDVWHILGIRQVWFLSAGVVGLVGHTSRV